MAIKINYCNKPEEHSQAHKVSKGNDPRKVGMRREIIRSMIANHVESTFNLVDDRNSHGLASPNSVTLSSIQCQALLLTLLFGQVVGIHRDAQLVTFYGRTVNVTRYYTVESWFPCNISKYFNYITYFDIQDTTDMNLEA